LNRGLKLFPNKNAFRVAWLPLLTLGISILFISCASQKPEADEIEASSSQEEGSSIPPDGTDSKSGEDSEGADFEEDFSSPTSKSPANDDESDSEAAETDFAVAEDISEAAETDSAVAEDISEAAETDSAVAEDISEAAETDSAVAEDISEAAETDFAVAEDISEAAETDSAVAEDISEAAEIDFAVAEDISEAAETDSERDSPETVDLEESDQPSSALTPATVSNQQSEMPESNPLLLADRLATDSTGVEETPEAASALTVSEIQPSVIAVDSEQSSQSNEDLDMSSALAVAKARSLEEPGELTIELDSLGWIFRSDRSTPGTWHFLGREIVGDSTSFHFLFNGTGKWNFVFERQNLSSGESEEVNREVAVGEAGNPLSVENGPIPTALPTPVPGIPPSDANARYAAALAAAAAGKIDEAVKYYEQDASRNDSAGARARDALMEIAAEFGIVGPLLSWLPRYLEDSPNLEVLRAALEVLTSEAGYDVQNRAILEKLAESEYDHPEWLYRLAVLLEKPGEERDLDRAAQLYQEVITRWPLTKWCDRSEERLLWLQRHYFRVR